MRGSNTAKWTPQYLQNNSVTFIIPESYRSLQFQDSKKTDQDLCRDGPFIMMLKQRRDDVTVATRALVTKEAGKG